MRSIPRAMIGMLALVAGLAALPLTAPRGASADGVVVGGHPASVARSPWVVALSSRERFGDSRGGQFCGGAVVAPRIVVTAAHCLSREVLGVDRGELRDLRVIAGRDDLRSGKGAELQVQKVWVNPAYDRVTNDGDIAALTLAQPLPAEYVIPIAGHGDAVYRPNTEADVYGWGDTTGEGDYALTLHSARVRLLNDAECERAYPGSADGKYRRDSMVCAGEPAGGHDACQGDSGGPLVAHGRLIGLVSWGSGCGAANNPGVYTRISAVVDLVARQR